MAFQQVKQFKELTLDYDAPLGAYFYVYTDLPGTAMALRLTITLPATGSNGRRSYTAPLDAGPTTPLANLIEGRLIKFRLASSGVVRVYGGTIRWRPVGVYIDGSLGELWETQELDFTA